MIIDPPFRWFEPRDALEASIADPGYQALSAFMEGAASRLREGGRILLFFGSSGDLDFVMRLVDRCGFDAQQLAKRELETAAGAASYFTWRLTPKP